jgi:tRNA pseudouridine55 synthase
VVFGFLNIDKPLGMTSHDVVARVRRGLKIKKVGHAGTLDPLATGVLVVCVGAATRLSEYVMRTTKRYRARVHLGVATATYDAEGEIVAQNDAAAIERAAVESALAQFVGDIAQVPPIYSAIKQGGRKLYDIARAGESVELQPRAVHIDSLTLSEWNPPHFTLDVVCSAGTYIRSLAHDLGQVLGVGAHLAGLTRTASGSFSLENAVDLDVILADSNWQHALVAPTDALSGWPVVALDAVGLDGVLHGRALPDEAARGGVLALAYAPNGEFVAILMGDNGLWKPHKVFAQQDDG